MADSRQVLVVLKAARGLIADEKDWTSSGIMCDPKGRVCALGAVARVIGIPDDEMQESSAYDALENDPAVAALIAASSISDHDEPTAAVWRLNDQGHHDQVLSLFDRAIATTAAQIEPDPEPTPNADMALAVLNACESAGEVVARQIVTANPELDFDGIAEVAASELFYAAQDTAWAFDMGVCPVRTAARS